jgi:crotonobetainyl-CoA:carnitine CoA-transferase CaiB-like acyl-CoA transferase
MDEEGISDRFLKQLDWTTLGYGTVTKELLERVVPLIARFLSSHTKAELLAGAVARRILLFPVSSTADILQNTQLAARRYFREVEHPDLATPITYPGAFVQASGMPFSLHRHPPRVGEHNAEIYRNELGLTQEELVRLHEAGVI